MSKKTDLRADVSTILKSLPQAEAELEEFLAGQIVEAQNSGTKDMEAIARFGQTAAIATMVSWKKVMLLTAKALDAAEHGTPGEGKPVFGVNELDKLGGLVTRSLTMLASLKTKAEVKAEQEILTDKDSIITRLAERMEERKRFRDSKKDQVDRNKLGVTKDGQPEGEEPA